MERPSEERDAFLAEFQRIVPLVHAEAGCLEYGPTIDVPTGIGVQVHYIPVHTQPYYRQLGFRPGQFPNAEAHYARAITIPLYAGLAEAQQDEVVERLLHAKPQERLSL